MIAKWCSYNKDTNIITESAEPIHFNIFIRESNLASDKVNDVYIARNKESLLQLIIKRG